VILQQLTAVVSGKQQYRGLLMSYPNKEQGIYAEPNFYKKVSSQKSDLNFTIKQEEGLVTEVVNPALSDVSLSYAGHGTYYESYDEKYDEQDSANFIVSYR
jgi:hypothetical protein